LFVSRLTHPESLVLLDVACGLGLAA